MFGSRRKPKRLTLDWTALLSLLEDDDRRAAVEWIAPTPGRESFLTALRRIESGAAAGVQAAGRQMHTAAKLVDRPTIAVAGMLNSGKTSLVAALLSPNGCHRTLRGTTNADGTHRFVLWLPAAWRSDVELWGLLLSRIGDALGKPPEMLSEDPEQAHAQYGNRAGDAESLAIPLVATDTGLDEHGIGLLDCPDIVSDASLGLGSPASRRAMLGRAATLCSAFLVVTTAESSRDATLADLLRISADLMPGVPRLLAVNKVRPRQAPEQLFEAFQPLARNHGVETIYAAYDFDVPASHPFIPGANDQRVATPDEEDAHLPVFFSLAASADENPPAAISADRLLAALPTTLDRGQLFEKFQLALESGLQTAVWDHGLRSIERHAEQAIEQSQLAQTCLLQAALEFFAHRDIGGTVLELRLHQSERIIRQLTESFVATAPWYARWGVKFNASIRRVFGGASDLIRQLTPSALAEKTASELKDKFRQGEYGGLLTPERLGAAIDRHGGRAALVNWSATENEHHAASAEGNTPSLIGQAAWNEAIETALLRFERDDFTGLDPRRLDEAIRQMWHQVPMHRKLTTGLTPLVALFATFGAAMMIPVDLGASWLFSASIPELFAAAGLTTLSAMWAGGRNTRHVGQQAAKQQVANFQAVLCDVFGIARPDRVVTVDIAGIAEKLPSPQIMQRESIGPTLSVYRVRDQFRQELQRLLPPSESGDS